MKSNNEQKCTKEEKKNAELKFSVAFQEEGESFQSIMEKILMSKLLNNA